METRLQLVSKIEQFLECLKSPTSNHEDFQDQLQKVLDHETVNGDISIIVEELVAADLIPLADRFISCPFLRTSNKVCSTSASLSRVLSSLHVSVAKSLCISLLGLLEVHMNSTFPVDTQLLAVLACFVASDDSDITGASRQILSKLIAGGINQGLVNILISSSAANASNSTVMMRYLSILSEIISLGNDDFSLCESLGAADLIIKTLRCEDALVQLVTMELLVAFAHHSAGLNYLFNHGVVSWLIDISCGNQNAPADSLLGPQGLRELGKILRMADEKRLKIPWKHLEASLIEYFLDGVKSYLNSSDAADRLSGIHAVTNFAGSSAESLSRVLNDKELVDAWMSNLSSTHSLQAAAIVSIAMILDSDSLFAPGNGIQQDESKRSSVNDLKRSLIAKIEAGRRVPISTYLIKMARSPVDPTKHAALNLICALIKNTEGWGMQTLINNPDFLVYLEDSSTEYNRLGKEWKFSVIDAIWQSDRKEMLGEEHLSRIHNLLVKGPFYSPPKLAEPLTI